MKSYIEEYIIDNLIINGVWPEKQQNFLDMCAYKVINNISTRTAKVLLKLMCRVEEPTVMQMLFKIHSSSKIKGLGSKGLEELALILRWYGIHIYYRKGKYIINIYSDNTKVRERFLNNLHESVQEV